MTAKDNVLERIAPQGAKNVLVGLLALAGFGLTVGLTAVDGSLDHAVRVGVLGAGGVLFLIGALLRYGGPRAVDEREAQLYYRAS
jgi:hypothetical protein